MSTYLSLKSDELVDWHRADIVAALHKKGWSLRRLSLLNGLSQSALNNALDRAWPKGERLIAEAIEVPASEIWPSRHAARELRESQKTRQIPQDGVVNADFRLKSGAIGV